MLILLAVFVTGACDDLKAIADRMSRRRGTELTPLQRVFQERDRAAHEEVERGDALAAQGKKAEAIVVYQAVLKRLDEQEKNDRELGKKEPVTYRAGQKLLDEQEKNDREWARYSSARFRLFERGKVLREREMRVSGYLRELVVQKIKSLGGKV